MPDQPSETTARTLLRQIAAATHHDLTDLQVEALTDQALAEWRELNARSSVAAGSSPSPVEWADLMNGPAGG